MCSSDLAAGETSFATGAPAQPASKASPSSRQADGTRNGMVEITGGRAESNPPPGCVRLPSLTHRQLLLPGALLVAIQAQLLAAFVFVDFRFATFFQ